MLSIQTASAQFVEVIFNFTGGQQSFVVPDGVHSIHIQAYGAQGADATRGVNQPVGMGGLGGLAEGDLPVTPGQKLELFVGGQGMPVQNTGLGGGGFNGGGDARSDVPNSPQQRGGGGGASDVRVGGDTLDDRAIVASGGGGASASTTNFGGQGGGETGGNGGGNGIGWIWRYTNCWRQQSATSILPTRRIWSRRKSIGWPTD